MDQTTSAEHHGAPPDRKNDAHELSGDLQLQQNVCAISAAAASTTTVDAPIVGAPHNVAPASNLEATPKPTPQLAPWSAPTGAQRMDAAAKLDIEAPATTPATDASAAPPTPLPDGAWETVPLRLCSCDAAVFNAVLARSAEDGSWAHVRLCAVNATIGADVMIPASLETSHEGSRSDKVSQKVQKGGLQKGGSQNNTS